MKRLGILTGGGDAPGLNAVIRAVVRVAICKMDWEPMGIEDGFEGVLDGSIRPLMLSSVRGLLPRGGTILGTTNRGRFVVNKTISRDIVRMAVNRLAELQLDALVVIGGDGSLSIAQAFYEEGAPIVGVPKTIDNDLSQTDLTFGFDSALDLATDAVDRLHTTAASHDRVMIVEVMGRDVGWIALHAGIAGGADVILIPEIPFSIASVAASIRARDLAGAKFSIIVVAEGCARTYVSNHPSKSVAERIAADLEPLCDHEIRTVVLGHLQRGGSPSAFDRVLATRFGVAAAQLVEQKAWGQMVALRGTEIVAVPISSAIGQLKTVPADAQLVRHARDLGITFGDNPVHPGPIEHGS